MAKHAFEEFVQMELSFYRGLSTQKKRRLTPAYKSGFFPAHHILFCGDTALCILGVKPCVHYGVGNWIGFSQEYHDHVVKPWFEKFQLGQHGFKLDLVTSAAIPPEVSSHPGFKGTWMLVNTQHPTHALTEAVFFSGKDRVANQVIGKAFGYPGRELAGFSTIYYMAADAQSFKDPAFPAEEICCVPMMEFTAIPADCDEIGKHYRSCADAMKSIGFRLAIDLDQCSGWPPQALIRLICAAYKDKADFIGAATRDEYPYMSNQFINAAVASLPGQLPPS